MILDLLICAVWPVSLKCYEFFFLLAEAQGFYEFSAHWSCPLCLLVCSPI